MTLKLAVFPLHFMCGLYGGVYRPVGVIKTVFPRQPDSLFGRIAISNFLINERKLLNKIIFLEPNYYSPYPFIGADKRQKELFDTK